MTTSSRIAAVGRLEQLNLNTQAQSVCSRCEVSDVINSGLGLVITPRWLCFRSSRQSCVYVDYYFYVGCYAVEAGFCFHVSLTSA